MSKLKNNPEEFIKDLDKALNLISKIDDLKVKPKDMSKVLQELKKINEILKEKYNNLDTSK